MKRYMTLAAGVAALVVLFVASEHLYCRFDLTSEKRYSISGNTLKLMQGLDGSMGIDIYLDGDLSADFVQLKKRAREMAEELKARSGADISINFVNPTQGSTDEERNKHYADLEKQGLAITLDNEEKDEDGQTITRIVCPWAVITYKGRHKNVLLYDEKDGLSRKENINLASGNLEYAMTDAIRQLTKKGIDRILFTEGHGELPELLTYDAQKALSAYYQIDRGDLGACFCPDSLAPYKAIIVAGPTAAFSLKDQYLLDQYIMNGGKVLWLVDGVRMSLDSLRQKSATIALINQTGLEEQLFRYGVRIGPVLLQDAQCTKLPVNTARAGEKPKWQPKPWYYAPLLLTSPVHSITKNLTPVRCEFASGLQLVGNDKDVRKDVLLVTSTSTHIQNVPSIVSMNIVEVEPGGYYFNQANIPVAVALEGHFTSLFANRMVPEGVYSKRGRNSRSYKTRMVVAADADIIRNDIMPTADGNTSVVPLGSDRYEGRNYGNRDFVLNCVNFLTDEDGWMELRSRELKLRLLNKPAASMRRFWQSVNTLLPLALLGLLYGATLLVRRRRYGSRKNG